ncbi:MAG: helix-turn-helix domain-containing protein [Oscillospiraceae bacterium]|nr:helix-turn-helix domain-containing protein [Oscillospiraceae bacterium]
MFYQRFLALCNTCGVKPTAVADAIGLSRTNASYWKKGSLPSIKNLRKLADCFEVPVEYLLGTQDDTEAIRDPVEVRETISRAESEKDRIALEGLLRELDAIPEEYRDDAIREMSCFAQYVLHKYRTMASDAP